MVALLLYAYARVIRSSRAVERACVEDVAFRVVAAHHVSDHTTIARFRQRHQDALAEVFGEVLRLCVDAGLVDAGVVAVDGTKVHANASERATCDYDAIAREVLAEAEQVDAEEGERFGDRRGDELPGPVASREGRKKWLAEAKRRLEERRAQEARPIPASRPARLREAKRRLEADLATEIRANDAYEEFRKHGRMRNGRRLGAHCPPKPYTPPDTPLGPINTTDLDSRNVKTPRGWVQGYNAQAATTENQIVIAAELTNSSADFGQIGRPWMPLVVSCSPRVSTRHRVWWSRTPATGTPSRCSASPAKVSKSSSRPMATSARALGRAGTAASTRSCAASWRRPRARSSTPNGRG
jgi:hypothetical protein